MTSAKDSLGCSVVVKCLVMTCENMGSFQCLGSYRHIRLVIYPYPEDITLSGGNEQLDLF